MTLGQMLAWLAHVRCFRRENDGLMFYEAPQHIKMGV